MDVHGHLTSIQTSLKALHAAITNTDLVELSQSLQRVVNALGDVEKLSTALVNAEHSWGKMKVAKFALTSSAHIVEIEEFLNVRKVAVFALPVSAETYLLWTGRVFYFISGGKSEELRYLSVGAKIKCVSAIARFFNKGEAT